MSVYKNRPEMSPDKQLWHYTTLEAVVAMVSGLKLRLTRLDTFDDPFEGSVPKQHIEDQGVILRGSEMMQMQMASLAASYPAHYNIPRPQYRDRWSELTRQRKAMARSVHAICWRAGDESEAMWRLYCNDGTRGQGLALRTTLRKLEQSVFRQDVIVSPVVYRHYHTGPAFTDDLDAFMHKRKGFEHESEVRLLTYDQAHYLQHAAFILRHSDVEPAALPKYLYLDWAALDTVEAIVVSPYATQLYEDEAKQAIEAISRTIAIAVELSEFSARRYEPLF